VTLVREIVDERVDWDAVQRLAYACWSDIAKVHAASNSPLDPWLSPEDARLLALDERKLLQSCVRYSVERCRREVAPATASETVDEAIVKVVSTLNALGEQGKWRIEACINQDSGALSLLLRVDHPSGLEQAGEDALQAIWAVLRTAAEGVETVLRTTWGTIPLFLVCGGHVLAKKPLGAISALAGDDAEDSFRGYSIGPAEREEVEPFRLSSIEDAPARRVGESAKALSLFLESLGDLENHIDIQSNQYVLQDALEGISAEIATNLSSIDETLAGFADDSSRLLLAACKRLNGTNPLSGDDVTMWGDFLNNCEQWLEARVHSLLTKDEP
jgi:hypothetical protein